MDRQVPCGCSALRRPPQGSYSSLVWPPRPSGGGKPRICESQHLEVSLKETDNDACSLVFDDLSPGEMIQVKSYLQHNLAVPLVDAPEAESSDNCIYSIVLQLPPKAEVLKFLDHQGPRPARQALAVVYFGHQKAPNITEYVVGPLPDPTYHQDVTVQKYGGKLPYYRRFFLRNETEDVYSFLKNKEYPKAPNFMDKVIDNNATNLIYTRGMPPGLRSGDRKLWLCHFQNVPGFHLHPIGLEVQVDLRSLDASQWKVLKVFYNGQYFQSMEELESQFNQGRVKVVKVKKAPSDGGFSSLKHRVPHTGPGPLHYEPRGPRYRIRNNQVVFMSWSFAFGMDANRGPRVFDIQFKGERIVYELSVQDASAIYGSNTPASMLTRYMDLTFGLGFDAFTLIQGIDCPYLATYLDRHYFFDSAVPLTHKNSICIFEQNVEMPVRRHFDRAQHPFYGGLVDSILVFRSISTMDNYDYVWDFMFHQNRAVGVRVYASGYIHSSFYFGDASEFGNRVEKWTLGTIHTHNINFKVDMDIGGTRITVLLEMNLKWACAVLSICTIFFILVWVFRSGGGKPRICESQHLEVPLKETDNDAHSLVFDDLSPAEMIQVKSYLQQNLGVPLVDAPEAETSDNCIYSIVLQLPPKAEVLKFLDHQGPRPARQALAVVYFGNQKPPNITEYVVGPLPDPTYHQDVTVQKYGGKLPYYRRFFLRNEIEDIYSFLKNKEYPKAPNFMYKVIDNNTTNLMYTRGMPPGLRSGDRKLWLCHFQNVSGYFVHPIGLEVQVDLRSLDASQWKVLKVFYNGQYFQSMEELESQFNQGRVKVIKVNKAPSDGGFSSLKQRVPNMGPGPLHYEPRGPRYRIRNNQVVFMSWSFAFGIEAIRGAHVFDIRFKGERIIYELSVQDASALYGSNTPASMLTRYMDIGYGLGYNVYTLVQGIDCPYLATYLDRHYFFDSAFPVTHGNSICIFEENAEMPVRRHLDRAQKPFYGGLVDSVLVFRSITTVDNYDYVWDFMFHQNGAVGVRVHASGYIQSAFYFGDASEFGNRVAKWTLGTMHTHNINLKVDMDVGGEKNSLLANDMAFETVKAPWSPEDKIHRMRMVKKVLDTEDKAAFRLHEKMPKYIYFAANSTNKWGLNRGYRIQIVSFSGDHMPESDPMERAISWGRYKLAVTKRKESEPVSTCPYNQMDPWTPSVAFADFINNETIVNEDLVAWITLGFLHIPHAEDIPNTATLGNVVGFLLRPYNYYDDDPSMYSPDSVFLSSEQDPNSCEVNHLACLPKVAACVPNFPPFNYEGFQNQTMQ
ncbi:hypothetical protein lerEdw1_008254 [Lerista edwardsae]|nr:hypothetical protein lerEdw1_008254 [Lerista edwardsae]